MIQGEIARHQVAIAGRVTEAVTGQPIAGARVEIMAAPAAFTSWLAVRRGLQAANWDALPERPDRVRTAADGHYHFMDLPDGNYTLCASVPAGGSRCGTAQAQVNVTRHASGDLQMAAADMTIPLTAVEGRVTDQASKAICLAEVRVRDSGERTFSVIDVNDAVAGRYRLAGLEASKVVDRILVASAPGYKPTAQAVRLSQAGEVKTVDFVLDK